ncbi:MAG TPA: hypothetical protein VN673_12450 [Clostridia bacterium]|nr:hypothetical protein [Clostridia bacterium]
MKSTALLRGGFAALVLLATLSGHAAEVKPMPPARPPAPPAPPEGLPGGMGRAQAGFATPDRTIIITRDTADRKALADVEEDLNVMGRVLEKAVNPRPDHERLAMGIVTREGLFGAPAGPRNLYLEGYGALFFLNVNFPLVAPPVQQTEAEDKEETSSEWENARRELYNAPTPGLNLDLPGFLSMGEGAPEEYDAGKVESLKDDLIGALKNAAHIRRLKPDETVTVVVTGRNVSGQTRIVTRRNQAAAGTFHFSTRGANEGPRTRMILRASKADIEKFQKGKTDPEQFRERVSVTIY